MAATTAAVTVFIGVYVAGFLHSGVLLTLLLGWVPAAVFAWLTARALRSAARSMFELAQGLGTGSVPVGATLQPIDARSARRVRRRADDDRR
jgi:hypothetical protein